MSCDICGGLYCLSFSRFSFITKTILTLFIPLRLSAHYIILIINNFRNIAFMIIVGVEKINIGQLF